MMIRRTLLIFLVGLFAYLVFPQPEAKAMDPVTIAILTPIAIQVAREASPYIIRGFANAAKGFVAMGKDMIDVFRLPLGFFQTTFLCPWYLKDGIYNLFHGGIAPLKLGFHAACLPLYAIGMNIP